MHQSSHRLHEMNLWSNANPASFEKGVCAFIHRLDEYPSLLLKVRVNWFNVSQTKR